MSCSTVRIFISRPRVRSYEATSADCKALGYYCSDAPRGTIMQRKRLNCRLTLTKGREMEQESIAVPDWLVQEVAGVFVMIGEPSIHCHTFNVRKKAPGISPPNLTVLLGRKWELECRYWYFVLTMWVDLAADEWTWRRGTKLP